MRSARSDGIPIWHFGANSGKGPQDRNARTGCPLSCRLSGSQLIPPVPCSARSGATSDSAPDRESATMSCHRRLETEPVGNHAFRSVSA
jgi:hypothetical protein